MLNYQTERLIFMPLQADDLEKLKAVLCNPEVMNYTLMDCLTDPKELKKHLDFLLRSLYSEQPEWITFTVFESASGLYMGLADFELRYFNHQAVIAEIGYFLLPEFHGKGYAAEMAAKLLEICFS